MYKIKTNINTNYIQNKNTNINSTYAKNNKTYASNSKTINLNEPPKEDFYNTVLQTGKLKYEDLDLNRIAETEEDAYKGNFSKVSKTDYKMARLSYEIKNNGLVTIYDTGIKIGYTDLLSIKSIKKDFKKRQIHCDLINYLSNIEETTTLENATKKFNKKSNNEIEPIKTTVIPNDIKQGKYTVTCYESDGWHMGGSKNPTEISKSSQQKKVHNIWNEQGSNYKNGIATLNVNGTDRYLIAVSEGIGKVGDILNVNLKSGETIQCVVADAKSVDDKNYTEYGHKFSHGVNVLEFEVKTQKYNELGQENPGSEKWPVEWDSTSPIKSVENYGSIIEA